MQIFMQIDIKIIHDKRHQKKNGSYAAKIRIYHYDIGAKHIGIDIDLSENEFDQIWTQQKPRKHQKEIWSRIIEKLSLAEKASSIKPFNFDRVRSVVSGKTKFNRSLEDHFHEKIKELQTTHRYGSAEHYVNALKRLKKYKPISYDINVKWLEGLENFYDGKLSTSSLGITLRNLRHIMNRAIKAGDMRFDQYPFRDFTITEASGVKKALNRKQLVQFRNETCLNDKEQMAKDFWFFSFAAFGMNVKDICHLKWSNVDDSISYYRSKNKRTRSKPKPIIVPRNKIINEVIDKYGLGKDYVFDILTTDMDEKQKHYKVKRFNKFINEHLKPICKRAGIPDVTTYWARHTFSTQVIRTGGTMEFISEVLDHSDMKTTKRYFAGFEDQHKKDIMDKLIDFD